jgi:[acyl-carrier-protein] S-malonyltransferase
MVSLIGADEASATLVCDRAAGNDVLVPANYNCPGQVVLSGSAEACRRAIDVAEEMSLRAVQLPVAGAFHSPLMEPAARSLAEELARTALRRPHIPVLANVDENYHDGPDSIRDRLAKQLTHPVRWEGCVRRLIADGLDRAVEVGPGRVLTGLMRKIDRRIEMSTLGAIDAIRSRAVEVAGR